MNRTQIPAEILPTFIGKKIHVSPLRFGCVFKLMAITTDVSGEKWIHLETPKTRVAYRFKAKHAEYLKKDIPTLNLSKED